MFRSTLSAFVVIGAALPVFAQSGLGDISQNCQNAFLSIVSDKDASSCLNANGLVTAASKTGENDSLVQPVTDWVTGMCAAGPCSNSTLQMVVETVFKGCSAELGKAGLSTSDTADVVKYVQQGYPTVRKVLCLKDNDANKLCINEDLSTIEGVVGKPLSVNTLMDMPKNVSALLSIPKDKMCSACVKGAYTIVKQDYPSLVSNIDTLASGQCGSDFVNGEMPSNIQQTAAAESKSDSKNDSKNGASSFAVNGVLGVISAAGMLSALVAF